MAKKEVTATRVEYSDALAEQICEAISNSEYGLHQICKENPHFPRVSTIYKWLADGNYPVFVEMYTRAKAAQAEYMRDSMLKIVDDGTNDYMTIQKGDQSYNVEDREVTSRSKLRFEARKWLMAKLNARVYGDKIDVTTQGEKVTMPSPVIQYKQHEHEEDTEESDSEAADAGGVDN